MITRPPTRSCRKAPPIRATPTDTAATASATAQGMSTPQLDEGARGSPAAITSRPSAARVRENDRRRAGGRTTVCAWPASSPGSAAGVAPGGEQGEPGEQQQRPGEVAVRPEAGVGEEHDAGDGDDADAEQPSGPVAMLAERLLDDRLAPALGRHHEHGGAVDQEARAAEQA